MNHRYGFRPKTQLHGNVHETLFSLSTHRLLVTAVVLYGASGVRVGRVKISNQNPSHQGTSVAQGALVPRGNVVDAHWTTLFL